MRETERTLNRSVSR